MDVPAFDDFIAIMGADVKADESFSDPDDYDDYDSDDPDITLESIEKSKTINFSIRANYTNWEPREAFREIVQNWRDAIIKSFNLAERDFCVVREEKTSGRNTEVIYKVPRFDDEDKKEWLGYIRFKGRDGEGTIEVTNRSATLQPWHLDLGGTSKAGDNQQAGAHGEGLKIALLVLMRGRQNHCVRCRSGGFNWTFNFTTRGRLVARLRRMPLESIRKAEDQARRLSERTLLPFATRPKRDVQFVIGEGRRGRNDHGTAVKRSPVKREDFDAWTKAALFLHDARDGEIIYTTDGDLLTHPQLRGNIYLKGLLLYESTPWRSASITNQPLMFGYNFAFGQTNRERQSVAGAMEESRAILAIWKGVLAAKPQMVQELSSMLNTTEPQYADVAGAKKRMRMETASKLKEYLCGEQFADKWYYCGEDKSKNPRLDHIIHGLGCEGVELTTDYWAILRGHGLVRTAEEEEHRRFTAAPPAVVPNTAFATSVCRLLRSCVRACPKTNGLAISFVQAGQLHLQLFFSEAERLLRIHERWLSVDGAINELGLPDTLAEVDVIFHTVKRLFADALEQVPRELFLDRDTRTAEWQRKLEISYAEQRLLNHLRMGSLHVHMSVGSTGRPMSRVRWSVHSQWGSGIEVEIQCHRASQCSHLRDSLLTAEDVRSDTMACIVQRGENSQDPLTDQNDLTVPHVPTCRACRADHTAGAHYEYDLEEGEEYFFVLVTLSDPGAFISLSDVTRSARQAPLRSPVAPSNSADEDSVPQFQTPRASANRKLQPQRSRSYTLPKIPTTNSLDDDDSVIDVGGGVGSSPEPELMEIEKSSAPAKTASAKATAPVANSSTTTRRIVPVDSFTLGPRLQSLDIFEIDKERWYEAKSSENVRAVIGIMKGEKSLPEETRKRRRVSEVV